MTSYYYFHNQTTNETAYIKYVDDDEYTSMTLTRISRYVISINGWSKSATLIILPLEETNEQIIMQEYNVGSKKIKWYYVYHNDIIFHEDEQYYLQEELANTDIDDDENDNDHYDPEYEI